MCRMGHTHDEMLQAAEAEALRASEALNKAEEDLAIKEERLEQIEDEPFDTPEEEAALNRRIEIADEEGAAAVGVLEPAFERARDAGAELPARLARELLRRWQRAQHYKGAEHPHQPATDAPHARSGTRCEPGHDAQAAKRAATP